MIFTNNKTGKQFEQDKSWTDHISDNYIVIRPIKPEPKWTVHNNSRFLEIHFDNFEPQAQLIKEAVEALMEYIFTPIDYENPVGHISAGREAVFHEARKGLHEV